MGKINCLVLIGLVWMGCFFSEVTQAGVQSPSTVILVDKSKNMLYVGENSDGSYKILKSYHATLGQVQGDKESEDDLKTPEGIYTFTSLLKPPALQKKFGVMSFYMNFPNAFDQIAGRTGKGIMLHATDEPDRLKKKYDSQGCVVVKNEEIQEIKPYIRLGLTPILVFSELTPEYMNPGKDTQLTTFFQNWLKSWESKDINHYIEGYHSDFSAQGKTKEAWRAYKRRLNQLYSKIEIHPQNVLFYRHPKYSMITFTQNYLSHLKSGGIGHRSKGTKILYVAEEHGQLKIIAETFTDRMW